MSNPLQSYNFVPTTVLGNQFLGYRQSADYLTNYQNSSDLYAYYVNNASSSGVTSGHQLRQYLQDNGNSISENLFNTSAKQFMNMEVQGSPNSCGGAQTSTIYSGNQPLVNSSGQIQQFAGQCEAPGTRCMMKWDNTPLPQQGPHCQVPSQFDFNPYTLLG